MRLNKYISLSGVSSRREAEELIKSATITVNDKVEMDPGYRVSPGDKIKYDEKIKASKVKSRINCLNCNNIIYIKKNSFFNIDC